MMSCLQFAKHLCHSGVAGCVDVSNVRCSFGWFTAGIGINDIFVLAKIYRIIGVILSSRHYSKSDDQYRVFKTTVSFLRLNLAVVVEIVSRTMRGSGNCDEKVQSAIKSDFILPRQVSKETSVRLRGVRIAFKRWLVGRRMNWINYGKLGLKVAIIRCEIALETLEASLGTQLWRSGSFSCRRNTTKIH